MKIIDIRKHCKEDFDFITVYNNRIYYCKADNLENKYRVDFYYYDIKEKIEYKITDTSIDTLEFYNKKVCTYDNCILFSMINKDDVQIFKLDMNTNKIDIVSTFKVNEEHYAGISFLGKKHLIFYVDKLDVNAANYDAKKDLQGEYESAYLYDIYGRQKYEILDGRIVWGVRDYLEYYRHNGEEFLIFEEAYMEDWEQEELYSHSLAKTDYYRESYRESINVIKLNEFIEGIKAGKATFPFHQLCKTEVNGWTRYFGMDKYKIYYRRKDFRTNIETIYSVDKSSFQQEKLGEIDFSKIKDRKTRYDLERQKIYSEYSDDNNIYVCGIYNSDIKIKFSKSIGDFDTIINDVQLFTYYWEEDEEDNYYDYMVIKNLTTDEEKLYQGLCNIIDDLVIIYE